MAVKTNSAVAVEAVRNYITDGCLDQLIDAVAPVANATPFDAYEVFKAEKGYAIDRWGEQNALKDWIQGLGWNGAVLDYNAMRDLVANWFQETPQEAEAYTNEQVETLYYSMVTRQFPILAEETTPSDGWHEKTVFDCPWKVQYRDGEVQGAYITTTSDLAELSITKENDGWYVYDHWFNTETIHAKMSDFEHAVEFAHAALLENPRMYGFHDRYVLAGYPAHNLLSELAYNYLDMQENLIDLYRSGKVDDDQYYTKKYAFDSALLTDQGMWKSQCELVSDITSQYFNERVTQDFTVSVDNEHYRDFKRNFPDAYGSDKLNECLSSGKSESVKPSSTKEVLAAAKAKADAKNQELKPQVQNHMNEHETR